MYVVGHEAIAPDFEFHLRRAVGEKLAIDQVVVIFKKDGIAVVTTMRNVAGNPGAITRASLSVRDACKLVRPCQEIRILSPKYNATLG